MKKIIDWLIWSSKDPKKVSLTIKMALIASVPYIIQALGITCSLGFVCINTDANELIEIAGHISNVALFLLLAISHLGVIYGFGRKIFNTLVK